MLKLFKMCKNYFKLKFPFRHMSFLIFDYIMIYFLPFLSMSSGMSLLCQQYYNSIFQPTLYPYGFFFGEENQSYFQLVAILLQTFGFQNDPNAYESIKFLSLYYSFLFQFHLSLIFINFYEWPN